MKRFLALLLLVLTLIPLTGCDPLYFTIKFKNTGTTEIDILGVYMATAGGVYGANLLPVEALHTGEYFILEGVDRWSEYDVKVIFDVWDPDNGTNYEHENKNNVPVAPPDDCVSWHGYYNVGGWNGAGYSWGCTEEDYDDYILVGE